MTAGAQPVRGALGLFAGSLALRAAIFLLTPFAAYPDAEYYVAAARQIAAGHGAVVPYVWAFVDLGGSVPAAGSLPIPAFGHWMPLASFIQVPFIWLLGPTDFASALPFLLLGAALAPFTFLFGRDLLGPERAIGVAALAGMLAVVPPVSAYLSQPDNYALYGLLGAGALWLTGRAVAGQTRRPALELVLAGLLAGLAFLARTDGFLIAAAIGLSVLWSVRHATAARLRVGALRLTGGAVGAAIACLAIVVPWEARNLATFGVFSESAASGRVLYIRDFGEHFGADGPLRIDHLLSWGLPALLWSRVVALAGLAAMTVVGLLAVVQVPFAAAGAWSLRRRAELGPFAIWAVLFGLWSVLVVPAPFITTGNFLHSAQVLLPVAGVCTAVGIGALFGTLGRRRGWTERRVESRVRFWSRSVVALTALLAAISIANTTLDWHAARDDVAAASAWLATSASGGSRIMSVEPGALYLAGGWTGVQTPESPLATIRAAARAYDVRYVVLTGRSVVSALQPILAGARRPDWLGPAAFTLPSGNPAATPRVAIYPVVKP